MDNPMDVRYKPTTHGRNVMAACMALEKPLKIVRVAFGSGKVDADVNLADVHELLEYVSDGAVAERRHEDDRLYLTVQYANRAHPGVKMFMLSEFIVYTEDPETKEEIDLLYGTLGDYRQPVPAYNPAFPPSEFNFPLELIISDEVQISVSAPAGLVTYTELIRLLNSRAAGAAEIDIIIPRSGWAADQDTNRAYGFCRDIASTDITENMIPMLTVHPQSLNDAGQCQLCPVSRTLPGLLRVYAKSIPASDIAASLTLLDTAPQHGGLASSAAVAKIDIEIPTDGWIDNAGTDGSTPLYVDIQDLAVEADLIPMLTIVPECLEAASDCGLSPYVRTLSGALRVYAERAPDRPIAGSLALLGTTQSITGTIPPEEGESGYVLPIASSTTPGVVKVGRGSGLRIDSSGNLSLDTATTEDVANIFGSNG